MKPPFRRDCARALTGTTDRVGQVFFPKVRQAGTPVHEPPPQCRRSPRSAMIGSSAGAGSKGRRAYSSSRTSYRSRVGGSVRNRPSSRMASWYMGSAASPAASLSQRETRTTLPLPRSASTRALCMPGDCGFARGTSARMAAANSLIWSGATLAVFTRACMDGSSRAGRALAVGRTATDLTMGGGGAVDHTRRPTRPLTSLGFRRLTGDMSLPECRAIGAMRVSDADAVARVRVDAGGHGCLLVAARRAGSAGFKAELLQEAGVVGFEPLFLNLAADDPVQVGAGEGSLFAARRDSLELANALGPAAVADGDHVALGDDYLRGHPDFQGGEPCGEHLLARFAALDWLGKPCDMADIIGCRGFVQCVDVALVPEFIAPAQHERLVLGWTLRLPDC